MTRKASSRVYFDTTKKADPKPEPRVKDPDVYKQFHRLYDSCLACGNRHVSAAHLLRGAMREDALDGLIPLCGGGSGPGCHAAFDSAQAYRGDFGVRVTPEMVKHAVARHLRHEAGDDQREYLIRRLGADGAEDYIDRLENA